MGAAQRDRSPHAVAEGLSLTRGLPFTSGGVISTTAMSRGTAPFTRLAVGSIAMLAVSFAINPPRRRYRQRPILQIRPGAIRYAPGYLNQPGEVEVDAPLVVALG